MSNRLTMRHAGDYIRPSAMKMLSLCAGAAHMQAEVWNRMFAATEMDEVTAKEAELGTAAHTFMAAVLTKWQILRGERRVLDIANEHLEQIPIALLDRWTRSGIRYCCEYAQSLIDKHQPDPEDVLVEQHLDGSPWGIGRGGTADLILVLPFRLLVIVDWKFGFLEQDEAESNDQGASYGVMGAQGYTVDEVHVHLVQPRADDKRRRATAAKYRADAILETGKWMLAVAERARDPDAELSPSYDACHYCSALPFCPEARSYIMNAREAAEMIEPETPEEWGQFCDAVKLGQKWSADGYELIRQHREASGPGSVANWKLRAGRTQSRVTDPKEALIRAAEIGMLDAFGEVISVSAKKLLDISEEHRGVFSPLVEEFTTKPSLVKGSES